MRHSLTLLRVVALALIGLSVAPFAAHAQPKKEAYRIGFLGQINPSAQSAPIQALRDGLRELGYREGTNLTIEYRWAEGALNRLPGLASELVRMKVDVIVTHGTPGSRAAKGATSTIPIVMASISDPVSTGVVNSLSRPGGNITGLSIQDIEVTTKRLELLKQARPAISRIVYLAAWESSPHAEKQWSDAARSLGLDVRFLRVGGAQDLARAFSLVVKEGAHAVLVQNSAPLRSHAGAIAALAVKHQLPTVAAPSFVDDGVLLGYGVNGPDIYRRAAGYVDKILKGARPGDLPIEQPTKFELTVNLKTAKALGLNLPREIVGRADRVIE